MKMRSLIALAGSTVLLAACIPSVHPFYTEKDLVFDPGLVGVWTKGSADETEVWKFEPSDGKAYKLTVTDKDGKRGAFSARLFKLKSDFFLDIVPTDCEYAKDQADLVAASMFPGHLLMRVPKLSPQLQLAFFDFDWLADYLEANPKALAHYREDKRIVLTAPTTALQKFVLQHIGKDELFDSPEDFVRQTDAP